MSIEWNPLLVDQLDWHWHAQLRPRLSGLSDEEYLWEPVGGCLSIRDRADSRAGMVTGTGQYVMEHADPHQDPPPVATIAWRMAHVTVAVFGARSAAHFGGPPVSYETFDFAPTAAGGLTQLDEAFATWVSGVRGLGEDGLERPCGPAEGPFATYPLAALVLHIHREALHHGAEIALLRDLYRDRAR